MNRINQKSFSILAITICLCLAAVIVSLGFVIRSKTNDPEPWVLHSYGNNVALYNGDEIIEVYGSITLDTLPKEDKRQLENGIFFQTKEEAISAIEDYDG